MHKKSSAETPLSLTSLFALLFLLFRPGNLSAQGDGVRVLESGPAMIVVEVTTPDYQVEPLIGAGEDYLWLRAPGCGYNCRKGEPLLPVKGFLVGMPLQGGLQLRVLEQEWTCLEVGLLCPVPTPNPGQQPDGRAASWQFSPDGEIYGRDAFCPTVLAEAEPLGFFRDQRIGRVQIFPFRYNPVTRQLKVCPRLVVQVKFSPKIASTFQEASPPGISPAAERVLSDMLLNYTQAKPWRQEKKTQSLPRTLGYQKDSPRCRIAVSEDGLYSIGRDELEEAGLDLRTIDPRTFQMSNKGKTVPIYVIGERDGHFDEGDAIEFYGERNTETYLAKHEDMVQDPYDSKNIYWLSWGSEPGARMVEEDGGILGVGPQKPICYQYTVHAEEDNYRDHLSDQSSLRDHWFWDSGVSAQQMKEYPLHLPYPDRDSPLHPLVRVMLHGLTSSEEHDPDHHVLIYLNEHLVADRMWDGQDKLLVDSSEDGFALTSSAVQEEDNVLSLICPGDTDAGPIDKILLNWIQVEYPRLYRAEDDILEFGKPKGGPAGLYQFTIDGFSSSSIWVYKLGTSVMVNGQREWMENDGEPCYQLSFQDEIYDDQTTYLAVTSTAKKKVQSIELRPTSDLRAPGKGADYVIIVHEDFYERVLPLAEFRESQGLQVEVIQIGEIYDQFSHGLFTPEAIRDFLKYAHQNWDPQPLYVLLVGDGNWDYKDTMGLGGNYIPPIMAQTLSWGATPCDNLYACVNGDDQLPDLFLGRLPVQTGPQLDAIIDKIIGGEKEPQLGDWRRRLLFICGSGTHGPNFRMQSDWLIQSYVTTEFLLSRVYAYAQSPQTDPFYGGTQDLLDALDEGTSLVNFIGHGGGGIWSDAGLMRLEDVDRLRNAPRWPMVISMTCFTAAFDEPRRDCLGERLLTAENRGVVGFWGATGLGWLWGDYYLDNALMETLFSRGCKIIGQAVTEAKLEYMAHQGGQVAQSLVNEYVLLGDPASKIGFPQKEVSLSIQPEAVNPGDTLYVQGTTDGVDQGQAQLSILDGAGVSLWESTLPVVDERFQTQVTLSPTCSTGAGTVRCYLWDSQGLIDGAGAVSFSLGQAFFDTVFTDPTEPTEDDSVHVWAQVLAPQGVDSILCRWKKGPVYNTQRMVAQSLPLRYRTAEPIPSCPAGTTIYYWVVVWDSSGQQITSNQHAYRIPSWPDLRIPQSGIALGGEEEVGIVVEVENLGQTQADSVLVRVTVTEPPEKPAAREGFIEHLSGESLTALFLPWDLPPGTYQARAEVDPEDAIGESNEANNVAEDQIDINRFNVTPQEGSMVEGHHAPAFSLDGNFSCEVPAGTVQRPQILSIQPEAPQTLKQPDLVPARLATGEQLAYQITFVDSSASLSDSVQIFLTFRLDGQDSLNINHRDRLAVYRWNAAIQRWIKHAKLSWSAPDSTSATVSGLGLFCPMINEDQVPPSIEVTVEEQHFSEGALVSSDATVAAVIQDANGVDVVERRIEVWHNGLAVDDQQIIFSPSPSQNSIPVRYCPKLPTGKHSITFSAYDCNGNFATKTVEFQVINSYGIDHVGNYPNPFDDETVFTYRLIGPSHAQEISLKIYTVSGRLVKTFHDFLDESGWPGTQLDYHMKAWDGRDEEGARLANGVYFYKIRAKWENQVVQRTGKLAILK